MRDMTSTERREWLNDFINHWVRCYGCGPLVGVCDANINGFTISGDKAVFVEIADDAVAFALYSENGDKVAEYNLNLETGMAVMVVNTTLTEVEYTNYTGILSDITAGLFNDYYGDAPFVLVNEPVRIDTTEPVVKPMSMEEIFADIVKKINEEKEEEEEWE
jgi:hypothetical protein